MNTHSDQPPAAALVIDDEPQIRRLLRVTLEANGYRVFDAPNGKEGIVQAAQCRPDIILLDLGRVISADEKTELQKLDAAV